MLIVYAHQSPGSFNAAVKNAAVDALTAQGCIVEISDLYAMKFKAAATAEDLIGMKYLPLFGSEYFSVSRVCIFFLQETRRIPITSDMQTRPNSPGRKENCLLISLKSNANSPRQIWSSFR